MQSDDDYSTLGASIGPRTLEGLARALGITYRTLMSWRSQGCKLERWDDGSYNVGAVRAWRRTKPQKRDPRTGSLWGRRRW